MNGSVRPRVVIRRRNASMTGNKIEQSTDTAIYGRQLGHCRQSVRFGFGHLCRTYMPLRFLLP